MGERLHLGTHARRVIVLGLLVALALTGVLIAAVVDGLLPGIIFAALAVLGMAATIIGDIQRRDGADEKHQAEQHASRSAQRRIKHERRARGGAG